jgi:hypothetical protein
MYHTETADPLRSKDEADAHANEHIVETEIEDAIIGSTQNAYISKAKPKLDSPFRSIHYPSTGLARLSPITLLLPKNQLFPSKWCVSLLRLDQDVSTNRFSTWPPEMGGSETFLHRAENAG